MRIQLFQLALVCAFLTACDGGSSYPESTEGLKSLMTDFSERANTDDAAAQTMAQELIIEDDGAAWFKEHYGDDDGETLAAEYSRGTAASLVTMMKAQKAKGRTEFIVEKFSDAKDPNAVGFQQTALEQAKEPVVLYSVRVVEPGKQSGQHLYNFVYDGGWKFAGPMKMLKPEMANDEKMNAVSSLRVKDREKFFETGELPD